MTMSSPILATAFTLAAAALVAMRAVAANRKRAMVKVRSQRHPANTKTQG